MRSILLLVAFVAFAYCQYDAGTNSIAAQICTDPNKPLRCQYSSVCVSFVYECPINNCTGNTPFLCSDLTTCVKSSSDCNCQGVICPDGSCKGEYRFCPLLEGCTELFPKRCPDGTCQPYNSACTNHTGRVCPSGLTLCIDGICRIAANCSGIPYAGCPLYQCPNGTCASSYTPNCLCPGDSSKALCFDGSCTPLGTPCTNKAPAFVTPMNQTYTVNTAVSNPVNIQIATTQSTAPSSSLGSIAVPSNSVSPISGGLSVVNVQAASSSVTSSVTTFNPMTNNFQKATLASPAISITSATQTNLASPATMSLNAPSGIAPSSLCVAALNQTTGTMSCQTTTVTKRDANSNSLSIQFTQLGTYALMFVPTCQVDGSQTAADFCASRNYAPLGSGYYCADNGRKFYQCFASGAAILPCSAGTSCKCCSSDECSFGNTISPCT